MLEIQSQLWGMLNIAVAAFLCMFIGIERQFHNKPAGARTHALVGLGAAAFMVVSKYGFVDQSSAVVDGSRIAAQVASGVGFLGGGLIFVRRDTVRGLTTAASIWVAAAVGLMAGAGQWIAAAAVIVIYHVMTFVLTRAGRVLPQSRLTFHTVTVRYRDGAGALRDIMRSAVGDGLKVLDFTVKDRARTGVGESPGAVSVILDVTGDLSSVTNLQRELRAHAAVLEVDVATAT